MGYGEVGLGFSSGACGRVEMAVCMGRWSVSVNRPVLGGFRSRAMKQAGGES